MKNISACKNWNQLFLKRPFCDRKRPFFEYGEISEKTPFSINLAAAILDAGAGAGELQWNQLKRSLFL
jgi:hypothetical protein